MLHEVQCYQKKTSENLKPGVGRVLRIRRVSGGMPQPAGGAGVISLGPGRPDC